MICTQEEWQDALYEVWEEFNKWYENTDIVLPYAEKPGSMPHHGCPPPLPPADDHRTVTMWQGKPILWSDPAKYPDIDKKIAQGEHVEVACMGVMFWFMAHAWKRLGLENKIPRSSWDIFKTRSVQGAVDGFAQAAVDLGWASGLTTNVEEIEFGDLVGIQRSGKIHHWCIAWHDPHGTGKNGKPCLFVMGAAPRNDSDSVIDIEERDKVLSRRSWVAAKMFR